jgi:MFS family permease
MGVSFFLNGLGSVLFFVFLTRLPYAFQSQGAAPVEAGRYAFFCVAGIAAIAAIAMLGLKPGRPASVPPRASIARLLAEGVAAARNPRIALAYGSAFTARADMGMITLFLTLWMVQAGVAAGADTAAATARAGALAGIAQGTALVSAPLFGIVGDRIDRVTLLAVAFAFATVGYAWVGVTEDILAPGAIPALICLGIGQVGTILASTVLMGQEAPASHRGAIFGVQSFCGALGILAISAVGGWLFDRVGPGSPFVLIGVANGLVLVWAVLVRLSARRSGASRSHPASAADS